MYACRFFINNCTLKTTMRNFFLYLKMDKDKEKWYDWNKWGWSSLGGKYPRLWQSDINGLNTSEAQKQWRENSESFYFIPKCNMYS